MELAENGQRFKNYLIDSIICGIVTLILFGIVVMIVDFDDKDAVFFNNYVYFFLLIRTIYYILFEYFFFRTIGKTITKTMVRTIDGNIPTFQNILGRSLCRLIPFNAISFLFGTGWHDSISKTSVVRESQEKVQ
jgi:uncharacterized RDD family membrane protein YckC